MEIFKRFSIIVISLLIILVIKAGVVYCDNNAAAVHNDKGIEYYKKGEYQKAIYEFTESIRNNPNISQTYNNRGNVYDILGQFENAIKDYNQAIKLKPNNAMAYANRGIAYSRNKKYEEALNDFDKAIALDPSFKPSLQKNIDYCTNARNKYISDRLKKMDPTSGFDKNSVYKNTSESGKELIGKWGSKDDNGAIKICLLLNGDGSYKRYKDYPDEKNIITGTWSYDYQKCILTINNKNAIFSEKNSNTSIVPQVWLELVEFKNNSMTLRNLTTLNIYYYFRK